MLTMLAFIAGLMLGALLVIFRDKVMQLTRIAGTKLGSVVVIIRDKVKQLTQDVLAKVTGQTGS
ncbi:MAG: hypothetical protein WBF90_34980 [Rivularia sp. (in: cyanobacteria)]